MNYKKGKNKPAGVLVKDPRILPAEGRELMTSQPWAEVIDLAPGPRLKPGEGTHCA